MTISPLKNQPNGKLLSCLTIDVEDWFHILDSPAVPSIEDRSSLESRIERNVEKLLTLLDSFSVKATFFWLGWAAEQHKSLVRKCHNSGHEVANHGYGHVLPYRVGKDGFKDDIERGKKILEDITGDTVRGFRAPGFGITEKALWAFDVIAESGHQYDSSVFPATRGHGGMSTSPLGPYFIETASGHLLEIPMSVVEVFGRRVSLFGGGYLRLATKQMIRWGISRLQKAQQPLIVYVHPREIDPDHPRLPLSLIRRFKCYVRLRSTLPKLAWLCQDYSFGTMLEMVEEYIKSFYYERKTIPVVTMKGSHTSNEPLPIPEGRTAFTSRQTSRNRLLQVEKAMADFLSPQRSPLTPNNAEIKPWLKSERRQQIT